MPPRILGQVDVSEVIADVERPILNRAWQEDGPPKDETESGQEEDEVKG